MTADQCQRAASITLEHVEAWERQTGDPDVLQLVVELRRFLSGVQTVALKLENKHAQKAKGHEAGPSR